MVPSFRPLDPKRWGQPGFGAALGISVAAHALLVAGICFWDSTGSGPGVLSGRSHADASGASIQVRFLALSPPPPASRPAERTAVILSIDPSIAPVDTFGWGRERRLPGAEDGMLGLLPRVGSGGSIGVPGIRGTGAEGTGEIGDAGALLAPRPRYTVLPPLDRPASVRGKSFEVRFWVDEFGRVTRVKVSPEIPDAEYRKRFLALMYEYSFEPARRPDGTPVAAQAILAITL